VTQDEAGQRKERFVNGGEIEQEKYFLGGKFQYPGLCFACLPTTLLLLQEGNGVTAGTFLTLSRGSSVRDSGRHWGITSSFLPSSTGQLHGHRLI